MAISFEASEMTNVCNFNAMSDSWANGQHTHTHAHSDIHTITQLHI